MRAAEFRRLALALPEAVEADHHGIPSFRVGGKIFATLPQPTHAHLFVDSEEVDRVVEAAPTSCSELWWGKKLAGVRVELATADRKLVVHLLDLAWRMRAPKKLLRGRDGSG
ncbi:MAG: MmcQ/YjbR family DNA-binding protein [Planctomycetes bacterium]|nr:MmcQ/YjbR family DNA-binding protein [Planctomycetota bacterium]